VSPSPSKERGRKKEERQALLLDIPKKAMENRLGSLAVVY